jgi:hypothetical protein
MMFRIVFWDVLPCNIFTRQYIPEDNSEQSAFLVRMPRHYTTFLVIVFEEYRGIVASDSALINTYNISYLVQLTHSVHTFLIPEQRAVINAPALHTDLSPPRR